MKHNIFSKALLIAATAGLALSACSPEDFDGVSEAGLPLAENAKVTTSVDDETNTVTFNMEGDGIYPMWYIPVDGKEVTATAKFTTPKAEDEGFRVSGSVDVTFKFDGRALAGTTTVVFEDVYYNEVKVFTHADLEDEAQTIEFPSVKTSVKDAADNDRKITAKGTATMIDTVT